ncbi:hypothetical protein D5086_004542 [Populus alba]|uniref:Uncharacterized protein n=1 Tax=Populus alba TaxID=43335 RepID=A0ACC4CS43_POPAL
MEEAKELASSSLSQGLNHHGSDPDDIPKSPPGSPNSSTRKACYAVLQSWASKKFMTGWYVAVTFLVTWWFIQFVDGFFSPIYAHLGIDIFGLGFCHVNHFYTFSLGYLLLRGWVPPFSLVGEWFIKRMPFVKHLYSASKQISSAISPDQNTTAFKEVAIIRHPRHGEYAFGFITSSLVLQSKLFVCIRYTMKSRNLEGNNYGTSLVIPFLLYWSRNLASAEAPSLNQEAAFVTDLCKATVKHTSVLLFMKAVSFVGNNAGDLVFRTRTLLVSYDPYNQLHLHLKSLLPQMLELVSGYTD